jgi:ribulose-phosphate 3-epimerase
MSVNPGFGGQKFIPYIAQKGYRLARLREELRSRALIEVDGGISLQTVGQVPWADVLVAGQAFFQAPDRAAFVKSLRRPLADLT